MERNIPILVVDDYAAMLRIARKVLGELGFTDVDLAPDGRSALEKLGRKAYGLVIVDADLEPMSAAELMTRAREINRNLPFIMSVPETGDLSNTLGDAAVFKPFNAKTLEAQMECLLGRHRLAA